MIPLLLIFLLFLLVVLKPMNSSSAVMAQVSISYELLGIDRMFSDFSPNINLTSWKSQVVW